MIGQILGKQQCGEHAGLKFWINYHQTWERADVDVVDDKTLQHWSFELAILNAGAPRLGHRLGETVKAWIDGTVSQQTAA